MQRSAARRRTKQGIYTDVIVTYNGSEMSTDMPPERPEVNLAEAGYWPRITKYDGRAIEQALAGSSLMDEVPRLRGGLVEATYAQSDPPILRRLRESGVPYLIDPQAVRFLSPTFLDVATVAGLPYAPHAPITPAMAATQGFVEAALEFQNKAGASAYVVPAFVTDELDEEWHRANVAIHQLAATANGSAVDRKDLIAFVAPTSKAMNDADRIVSPLIDVPIVGVYVQPTPIRSHSDSVEKLVRYARLGLAAQALRVPVFASRVGAFGLVLRALGWSGFDSGLGDAESFDLAALNRSRPAPQDEKKGGGRKRRVYIEGLKTTLLGEQVDAILAEPGLRARFTCNLGCCRFRGYEGLADRRREHYLRTRLAESDEIVKLPSGPLRLNRVHEELVQAREHAVVVERILKSTEGLRFGHLDRWIGALVRLQSVAHVAS